MIWIDETFGVHFQSVTVDAFTVKYVKDTGKNIKKEIQEKHQKKRYRKNIKKKDTGKTSKKKIQEKHQKKL